VNQGLAQEVISTLWLLDTDFQSRVNKICVVSIEQKIESRCFRLVLGVWLK
jgi:hypothetical protein